ncbi:Putative uncharacterized transposon-derived protein F52C9.6 [Eumeta japonica]|uniref:Uncharacterized transposon-derived protein F52C9.6 n=1 Tax=Eumeta variegata TaxID=151549 RepID=A0A4C1TQ72_EUMVA|nr:Putative uncharacterized transposon-derived protein F52C9.6 [Eumeta japonica]
MNGLDWSKTGLHIKGAYLNHLRFADDLVLLSETVNEMQSMIESLQKASTKVGLEMNLMKTKIITNSRIRPITINDNPIEYVENYIYLGKRVSFEKNNNIIEIERRIQLTWNKYWSQKGIFKSNLPITLKAKVMNTCPLPSLTYGSQTWKFSTEAMNKIHVKEVWNEAC